MCRVLHSSFDKASLPSSCCVKYLVSPGLLDTYVFSDLLFLVPISDRLFPVFVILSTPAICLIPFYLLVELYQ